MVNIRLAMVGKRPKLKFPTLKRGGKAAPLRRRPVYFDSEKPVACPIYDRTALSAGVRACRPGADRGARHHHRAAQGRRLPRGALGRIDHHRWEAPDEPQAANEDAQGAGQSRQGRKARKARGQARRGDAGSDPQRAAGGRQRDGRRPATHLLQHDDLRGARLLHRAGRPQGPAHLAERRRRLALRRRPRRHHRRRHEALRRQGLQAGRRHHHQSPGGGGPAPQQRRHLHALFLPWRTVDVLHGARALDRRRRHLDRLRRRAAGGRSVAGRPAARPAQDLSRGRARRARFTACSRTTSASPNPRSAT